jgi:hypothetical protein
MYTVCGAPATYLHTFNHRTTVLSTRLNRNIFSQLRSFLPDTLCVDMDDLSVEDESLAAHLHTPCRQLVSPGTNGSAAVAGSLAESAPAAASRAVQRLACVPALRIAVATRHRGLHVYPLPGGQAACAGESANGTFVVTRLLADRASDVTPVALLPHPLRVDGKPVVLAVVVVHNDEGNKKATKGQDTRSGDDGRLTGHAQKRSLLALDANALARGEVQYLAVPSALDCTRISVSPSGDRPNNSGNGLADGGSVVGLDAPRGGAQAAVALAYGRALLVSFGRAATSLSHTIHEPAAHAGARAVAVAAEFSAYHGAISTLILNRHPLLSPLARTGEMSACISCHPPPA